MWRKNFTKLKWLWKIKKAVFLVYFSVIRLCRFDEKIFYHNLSNKFPQDKIAVRWNILNNMWKSYLLWESCGVGEYRLFSGANLPVGVILSKSDKATCVDLSARVEVLAKE